MKLKNILLCASVLGGLALSSCTGNFLDEDRNPNSLDPEIVHGVHGRICSKTSGRANPTSSKDLPQPTLDYSLPSNGRNLSNATL